MSIDEGSETNPEPESDDAERPLSERGVGDGREKHVLVVTASGKEIDHDEVFLRHTETEYLVCADPDFPPGETTRYRKENIDRVKITQHHSNCFITTAAAGEGPTLDSLRGFRADVMTPTRSGRALLRVYEALSPPIAATLDRHPEAAATRLVRWLVGRCGSLADRRRASTADGERAVLSLALIGLYVVGICVAALGHGWLRGRERIAR
ncbi:CFI-box-CTERM domain-containing protein [Haloplanus rubicundus]|uniref:Uncharacterized protein n=1 Tax=Haloplanus rubicundus TaxID=1547898 RepID=A0A345EDM9_9EURY|nr:CFI-box-CTERM domain-containing protein [Haloplanus rubicundus]AXG10301.1 hypothetical protein DU484_10850 [Haloplanus rubicundus]